MLPTPPFRFNDRHRQTLRLLLHGDERRCPAAALRTLATRGWAAPGPGGAYRLTAAGRALAESLEPARHGPGGARVVAAGTK
jgi:hypothetical protein